MAEELGERVRTGVPVRRVERLSDGTVQVGTDRGRTKAKAVIIAVAPAHRGAIEFEPPLPTGYTGLAERWPQGRLSKAYAAYDKPFWREGGCSGEALSDEGPVFITFDVSPSDDGPGILLRVHRRGRVRSARPRRTAASGDRRIHRAVRRSRLEADRLRRPSLGEEAFAPGGPTAAVPRVPGPPTASGFGNLSTESIGPERKPRTSGPGFSTARCARAGGRPPRCISGCRVRTRWPAAGSPTRRARAGRR